MDEYFEYLCGALGHADRNAGLKGYCQGLMLPIERKSVEPLDLEVRRLVDSILGKSPVAVAMGKQTFYRQLEMGLDAFMQKRKPEWKGC